MDAWHGERRKESQTIGPTSFCEGTPSHITGLRWCHGFFRFVVQRPESNCLVLGVMICSVFANTCSLCLLFFFGCFYWVGVFFGGDSRTASCRCSVFMFTGWDFSFDSRRRREYTLTHRGVGRSHLGFIFIFFSFFSFFLFFEREIASRPARRKRKPGQKEKEKEGRCSTCMTILGVCLLVSALTTICDIDAS